MDLLLPVGTRLLHIGPPKTATTTLQSAFHNNREALNSHRVHYAGKARQPMTAALAAADGSTVPGRSAGNWPRLLREIEDADADRVMISSEFFSHADDEHARAVVEALGADRTHVVITLRPLVKIIPSQWQQYVRDRMRSAYPEWLDLMFNHADETTITPTFWRRHRHDLLVRRWAEAVGKQNLTVIVLDESQPERLLNIVEEMLGLPLGMLVSKPDANNRSMTLPEVEMMREFNEQFFANEWTSEDYTRFIRFGSTRRFMERVPAADEPKITTPQWAVDRCIELSRQMVTSIATSGVRILGDLEWLTVAPRASAVGDPEENPVVLTAELAARHSIDVIGAAKVLSTQEGNFPAQLAAVKQQLAAVKQQLTETKREHADARKQLRAVQERLQETKQQLGDSEQLRSEQSIHHHTARDLMGVVSGRVRARLVPGRRSRG